MLVPSLSWQNDGVFIYKWLKKSGVFRRCGNGAFEAEAGRDSEEQADRAEEGGEREGEGGAARAAEGGRERVGPEREGAVRRRRHKSHGQRRHGGMMEKCPFFAILWQKLNVCQDRLGTKNIREGW
jgi:hypothetical protein